MSNIIPRTEPQQNCYILSSDFQIDELVAVLGKKFACILEPARKAGTVYYDTFDWRLYRKGEVLALRQAGQTRRLSLQRLSDGLVKAVTPLTIPDQAIARLDIVPSVLRESIVPIIGVRALLPVVRIEGNMRKLLLRDRHDKLVARLSIELNNHVTDKQGRTGVLPGQVILKPVKGYQAELRQVKKLTNDIPALKPCALNQLDMALQKIGRRACDYSSKMMLKIDPISESHQAVKKILQHLLDAMEVNEPGMIENLDPEFLHDYRVAVRRIRSIVSQMKSVLPEEISGFFKTEFAWLGAVTTPARDLDVYLLEFKKLQLCLVPAMRDALLPFKEFLRARQRQAYKELTVAVNSARYKKLKQTLKTFAKSKIRLETSAPDAKKAIHSQADNRIWRCYRRISREAEHLSPNSAADDYHELRKSCKKLRYLLEFFQYLYLEKEIDQLIQQLKILQDNLGEFQDMDVQSIALRKFAKMMAEQGINNADTFMAMGVLADGMEHKKTELQHAFQGCYKKFSRQKYQKLFKKLFKPEVKPGQEIAHESSG